MAGARNWRDARDARSEEFRRPPVTSLLDPSLSALLLPLQRAAAHPAHPGILHEAGMATGSSYQTFPDPFTRLAVNFRPLIDACSRMREDIVGQTLVQQCDDLPPPPSSDQRQFTFPYPCISTNMDGIVSSLITVLDDLNRPETIAALRVAPVNRRQRRTLDEEKLKDCLSCDLCRQPLLNPYTSLICLHSFCEHCIHEAMSCSVGEKMCPVAGCGSVGEGGFMPTALGQQPLSNACQCIVRDDVLSKLCSKLFGRSRSDEPISQGALVPNFGPESVWMEDLGSLRRIQAKQVSPQLEFQPVEVEMEMAPVKSVEYLTVAVFETENEAAMYYLDDNYFYVPSVLTPCEFKEYLEARFQLNHIRLYFRDRLITTNVLGERALREIRHDLWLPDRGLYEEVFTLTMVVS